MVNAVYVCTESLTFLADNYVKYPGIIIGLLNAVFCRWDTQGNVEFEAWS